MLERDWLQIGYEKGIIDEIKLEEALSFKEAYKIWFKSKINSIKPQSVDRIEVTYNRYYSSHEIAEKYIHELDEAYIVGFLNNYILRNGNITHKEFQRIFQIVNNTLNHANDLSMGHVKLINWGMIKRNVANNKIVTSEKKEFCISDEERKKLFDSVVYKHIYPQKQCACYCVLLNFYLGLRIGELSALKWSDINLEKKYVSIHTTETKGFERDKDGSRLNHVRYIVQDTTKTIHSVRKIPLVPEAVYLIIKLKEYQQKQGYDTEFLACDGTATILSKSIERTIRKLCELCEINYFSSHKIRKTFASQLHRNGVPTRIISDAMGHSEIRTTERNYIIHYKDSEAELREAIQQSLSMAL